MWCLFNKIKVCDGVEWIHLAQDRVKWQAILTAVVKFQVP